MAHTTAQRSVQLWALRTALMQKALMQTDVRSSLQPLPTTDAVATSSLNKDFFSTQETAYGSSVAVAGSTSAATGVAPVAVTATVIAPGASRPSTSFTCCNRAMASRFSLPPCGSIPPPSSVPFRSRWFT